MLDRKIAPKGHVDASINFLKAKKVNKKSNNAIYCIDHGIQDIVKIEVVFDAGYIFEMKKMAAPLTNELILEGALNYTSEEIAEIFDNEGAFLENSCSSEGASFNLYCLTRSISKLIPIFREILFTAQFPESEFEHLLRVKKQKFLINNEKVSFQAKNTFLDILLGESNSYSNKLEYEDFDRISRDDIIKHYNKFYKGSGFKIFIAGKIEQSDVEIIEESFSRKLESSFDSKTELDFTIDTKADVFIEKKNAMQSAIKIGKVVVNRGHNDYVKLFLLNTLLGGYFGSRLMMNLREDKGYTYGVGSGIVSNRNLSYLIITTEVGASVTSDAMKEIEFELNKLQKELIPETELQLVKNYIIGSIQRNFDGAFAAIDRFKMLENNNLDYTYYENFLEEIVSVTSKDLLNISKEYLKISTFSKVIVGQIKYEGNPS